MPRIKTSLFKPLPASQEVSSTEAAQVTTDRPSLSNMTLYLNEIHFSNHFIGTDFHR